MTTGSVLWFLAIGAVVYFMMKKGGGCCGGHDHGGHGKESGHGNHASHEMSSKGVEMLSGKDPVCGMEITENEPTLNSEHLGQTVRFCSDRCKNLFDLNPEKYMSHSQGTHQHH